MSPKALQPSYSALPKPLALVFVPRAPIYISPPPEVPWTPQSGGEHSSSSEALLKKPGLKLFIKIALDPYSTCHLINLGDRCLPQQRAQKVFHILLQSLGKDEKSDLVYSHSYLTESHPFSPEIGTDPDPPTHLPRCPPPPSGSQSSGGCHV